MNHIELFSGVGGFRKAMDYISNDLDININTVAFSQIDKKATDTYCANFNTDGELVIGDIVNFVNDQQAMGNLPQFDLLSGGFPCQTFSVMGGQEGFEEYRGQMFFRIMDIVNRCHPNFILLENVKNLIKHDKGHTIRVILEELDRADYYAHFDIFNSTDFGLPQRRSRVVVFARRKQFGDFVFDAQKTIGSFKKINRDRCSLNFYDSVLDILDRHVEDKYYLSERIKPTILSNGSANFKANSDIDQVVARTLTASMHKMHRACQDNYYSDRFIQSNGEDRPSSYLTKEELAGLPIRKLTPKEAFMLQGFPEDFSAKASEANVADGAQYKQAGNAVSVNTIYAVMNYLVTNHLICE